MTILGTYERPTNGMWGVEISQYPTREVFQRKLEQVLKDLGRDQLPKRIKNIHKHTATELHPELTNIAHLHTHSNKTLDEYGRWWHGKGRRLKESEMGIVQALGFKYTAEENMKWPIEDPATPNKRPTAYTPEMIQALVGNMPVPATIKRIDQAHDNDAVDHIHFKSGHVYRRDGTWRVSRVLSDEERAFIQALWRS